MPAYQATEKAREYEKQLTRLLLKDLIAERGIPYDENEAKKQSLYSRYGMHAIYLWYHVLELCESLKKDRPELSNEDIKTRVIGELSKQYQAVYRKLVKMHAKWQTKVILSKISYYHYWLLVDIRRLVRNGSR